MEMLKVLPTPQLPFLAFSSMMRAAISRGCIRPPTVISAAPASPSLYIRPRCPRTLLPLPQDRPHGLLTARRAKWAVAATTDAQPEHAEEEEHAGDLGAASTSCTPTPAHMPRRTFLLGAGGCTCAGCLPATGPAAASPDQPGAGGGGGTGGWYDSFLAWNMQHGMALYEDTIAPLKAAVFAALFASLEQQQQLQTSSSTTTTTRVLELGCGTAPNLGYYNDCGPSQLQVVGLEPNRSMWQYAQLNAQAAGFQLLPPGQGVSEGGASGGAGGSAAAPAAPAAAARQLQLVDGTAEALPFPDNSFDAVVCTLVLCSVRDPRAALAEVVRVLRPRGLLLLVEHVGAPRPGLVRVSQQLLDPLQQLLAGNCHLARDTLATVRGAGMEVLEVAGCGSGFWGGSGAAVAPAPEVQLGRVMQLEVPGLGILSPHVAGIVAKPASSLQQALKG